MRTHLSKIVQRASYYLKRTKFKLLWIWPIIYENVFFQFQYPQSSCNLSKERTSHFRVLSLLLPCEVMTMSSKFNVKHNTPPLTLSISRLFKNYKSLRGEELLQVSKVFLINYARFWGFIPYDYDASASRIYHTSSRFLLWRWKFNIFLASAIRVLALGNVISLYLYSSPDSNTLDEAAVMRCWKLLLLLYTIFMHLHTYFKRAEVIGEINGLEIFYERHKRRCKD